MLVFIIFIFPGDLHFGLYNKEMFDIKSKMDGYNYF